MLHHARVFWYNWKTLKKIEKPYLAIPLPRDAKNGASERPTISGVGQ